MATLDNFHTGNDPTPLHPHLRARNAYIQQALYSNRTWDPANEAPVAPVATYHPGAGATGHPDPRIEERMTQRSMKDYLVPLQPTTVRTYGDTASGVLLVENDRRTGRSASWWTRLLDGRTRAHLPTRSRFAPYQR